MRKLLAGIMCLVPLVGFCMTIVNKSHYNGQIFITPENQKFDIEKSTIKNSAGINILVTEYSDELVLSDSMISDKLNNDQKYIFRIIEGDEIKIIKHNGNDLEPFKVSLNEFFGKSIMLYNYNGDWYAKM